MRTIGGTKVHVLWSFALCLVFSSAVVSLLAKRVEDVREVSTATDIIGWHFYPLALLETAGPAPPVYVLWLRPDSLSEFLKYPEFRPLFYTGGADVDLIDATLELAGTPCTYTTGAGAALVDGGRLNFLRRPLCTALSGTPTGEIKLVVRLAERRRISIGAWVPVSPAADQGPAPVRIIGTPGSKSRHFPVLRAFYVEHLPATGTRRIDLLAYMWQIEPATWMWQLVALACVLLFVSASITPRESMIDSHNRRRFALRSALGAASAAAALGVLYVVVTPPFQAADESHHFVGYAVITRRPDITAQTQRWSQLIHFDRLRFNVEQRFRPVHRLEPSPEPWRETPTGDIFSRGGIRWLWSLTAGPLADVSAERTLLALRLLNVLFFAAAVATAVAATAWLTDLPFPQLTPFVFLLIPSLPFFATFVSNYAILTSGYVVFSAAVLATVFGGRRGDYAGLLLGTSAAMVLLFSRSALPMAAMLSAVLAGRLLLGQWENAGAHSAVRRALTFWGGLAGGLATMTMFINPAHQAAVIDAAPPSLSSAVGIAGRILPLLYIGATGVAILIEIACVRIRRRAAARVEKAFTGMVLTLSVGAAVAVAASMLLSLFVDFPTLPYLNDAYRPGVWDYARDATLSSLGTFRLREPDFLMSTSFWAGFGWLDAIPPGWFTVALTTLTGCALIGLLLHLASHRSVSGVIWLAMLAAGWIITVPIYAAATWRYGIDIHGRYLIGLYLTVLPICWSLLMLRGPASNLPVSRWTLALAVCLTTHAYAMSVILRRYF
jgi:hypothetical protein